MSVNWINLAQEIAAGFCEYGNEPSVCTKLWYFLEYANDLQL
jgi:hypothetical protein